MPPPGGGRGAGPGADPVAVRAPRCGCWCGPRRSGFGAAGAVAASRATVIDRRFAGAAAFFAVRLPVGRRGRGRRPPPRAATSASALALVPEPARPGDAELIHLFRRRAPVTERGRRLRAPWPWCSVLVWLVAYPLVLVAVEGVRGPGGVTLDVVRALSSREPTRVAGALGQPLDLARQRGARGGARASRSPSSSSASTFPAAGCWARWSRCRRSCRRWSGVLAFLFLYGETGFVGRLVQAALGPRAIRRGGWRARGPSSWSTPTRCTSTSTSSPGPGCAASIRAAHRGGASRSARGAGGRFTRVTLPLLRPALARRGAAHLHDRRSPRSARPTSSAAASGS